MPNNVFVLAFQTDFPCYRLIFIQNAYQNFVSKSSMFIVQVMLPQGEILTFNVANFLMWKSQYYLSFITIELSL